MTKQNAFKQLILVVLSASFFFFSCKKEDPKPAPTADFTYNGAGAAPATVTFTNTSTNATSYLWDFGDNGTSTQQNPQHTYTTPGVFTVKLTATGAGGTVSTSKTVNIMVAPLASFTFKGADIAPSTVTFTNASTNATSYLWDFGDGGTSVLVNPVYTYIKGGNYVVTLTARNSGGSSIYQLPITIIQPTELKVKIIDNAGAPQFGATATLYSNLTDYTNKTNPVATTTTDLNGYMYFTSKTSNITSIAYYYYIKNACKDNIGYTNKLGVALSSNQLNTYNDIIISSKGQVKVINNSSNPYRVFIDGSIVNTSLSGNSTETYQSIGVGNHTVRVLQLSGYIFSPTDNSYNISVSCGTTTTVTFP